MLRPQRQRPPENKQQKHDRLRLSELWMSLCGALVKSKFNLLFSHARWSDKRRTEKPSRWSSYTHTRACVRSMYLAYDFECHQKRNAHFPNGAHMIPSPKIAHCVVRRAIIMRNRCSFRLFTNIYMRRNCERILIRNITRQWVGVWRMFEIYLHVCERRTRAMGDCRFCVCLFLLIHQFAWACAVDVDAMEIDSGDRMTMRKCNSIRMSARTPFDAYVLMMCVARSSLFSFLPPKTEVWIVTDILNTLVDCCVESTFRRPLLAEKLTARADNKNVNMRTENKWKKWIAWVSSMKYGHSTAISTDEVVHSSGWANARARGGQIGRQRAATKMHTASSNNADPCLVTISLVALACKRAHHREAHSFQFCVQRARINRSVALVWVAFLRNNISLS